MTRIGKWVAVCAAAMLAAGCGGDGGSDGLTPTGPQTVAGAPVSFVGTQSALSVTILGPNNMRPNSLCYWYSSVSGGTGPYTYYWYGGTSSNRTLEDFFASASNDFYLDLKVTDANGQVAWASEYIDVTTNTGACMM